MKVLVKRQFKFATDKIGVVAKSCKVGEEVELSDKLAKDLADAGYVTILPPENKRVKKSPENKSSELPKKKGAKGTK